jgi:hypothetical protein
MMNPRIREIYQQALSECSRFGSKPATTIGYDELEKFAELILKDCISEIAMIGVTNSENEDVAWAVDVAIKNIKNRFGVE